MPNPPSPAIGRHTNTTIAQATVMQNRTLAMPQRITLNSARTMLGHKVPGISPGFVGVVEVVGAGGAGGVGVVPGMSPAAADMASVKVRRAARASLFMGFSLLL